MALLTIYVKADQNNLAEARSAFEKFKSAEKKKNKDFNIAPAQIVDFSPVDIKDPDYDKTEPKQWRVVYNDYLEG